MNDNNNSIMKPNNIQLDNQILNSNEICKENVLICHGKQSNKVRVQKQNSEIQQIKKLDSFWSE